MERRRKLSVHRPRTHRRAGLHPVATLAPLAVLLLLAAACGGSASVEFSPSASASATASASPSTDATDLSPSPSTDASASTSASPSPGVTNTSPSPGITDASPSPDATDLSPSPTTSGLSAEQQVLADYFVAVEPVYEEFMTAWMRAYRIVDKRAHDSMDQTWAVAAGLLPEPLAQMSVARRMYREVAPIPASLIAANTTFGRCMANVQTYFAMARKGYAQGMDMDNDTAYGRKMSRIAKLDQRQYKTWKRAVREQAEQLGVPVPWSWKED